MALDKNDLLSLIATEIPDNTTEDILPANLRTVDSQIVSASANLEELTLQTFKGPISFTGGVAGTISNRIVINEYADFPDPLLPNTQYYIGAAVALPDILPASWNALPSTIEFSGNAGGSSLTYNGTGSLFKGGDLGVFKIANVLIDAPNAKVYDFTDTVGLTFFVADTASIISCLEIGTFDVFAISILNSLFLDAKQGVSLTGTSTSIVTVGGISATTTEASFILLDLGIEVISTFQMSNVRLTGVTGSVFLSGAAASANIPAGQRASIASCEVFGDVTPLTGIDENDIRYRFNSNTGIRDTSPDALISLSGNATATVISASSTDGSNSVLVAGTWIPKADGLSQYASTAAGKVSALFENNVPAPITAALTVEPVSGTNKIVAAYVVVDGVVQAESRGKIRTDNSDPKQITLIWQETQSSTNNTDIELHVENETDSTNILVSEATLRIR